MQVPAKLFPIKNGIYKSDGSFTWSTDDKQNRQMDQRKWLPVAWIVFEIDNGIPVPKAFDSVRRQGYIDAVKATIDSTGTTTQDLLNAQRTAYAFTFDTHNGVTHCDNTHNDVWLFGDADGTTPMGKPSNDMSIFFGVKPPAGKEWIVSGECWAFDIGV